MTTLTVRLFGKLSVSCEGRELAGLDACKAQELFCYLLVDRRPHPRESLAGLLWGDTPADKSKKYLRQALWQLQSVLDARPGGAESDILRAEHDWVQLDAAADLWLDVEVFERAYSAAQAGRGDSLTAAQRGELGAAVSLYRGGLLEGSYQDWCLYERERLENVYLLMLDKLMGYCEAHGDYDEGWRYGALALRHDRARERTHRRLMRLHYSAGDRTAALRQYERCVAALREELDVAPDRRTDALYQQIRRDEGGGGIFVAPGGAVDDGAGGSASSLPEVLGRLRQLQQSVADVQARIKQDIRAVESALRHKGGRPFDRHG